MKYPNSQQLCRNVKCMEEIDHQQLCHMFLHLSFPMEWCVGISCGLSRWLSEMKNTCLIQPDLTPSKDLCVSPKFRVPELIFFCGKRPPPPQVLFAPQSQNAQKCSQIDIWHPKSCMPFSCLESNIIGEGGKKMISLSLSMRAMIGLPDGIYVFSSCSPYSALSLPTGYKYVCV
jgi:hypothetical protein